MEGEGGVSRRIIDEVHSSDLEGDQMKIKVLWVEVSLMNFILRIYKEMKWKVKVVLLEVSLMHFIFRISNEVKWQVKVVFSKYL